ncbi:GerAB/ArcD/ProY family transporter [Lysinibacillus xylanilyticus]|uniref:Endospore germination permease n=1 Tax=Lysinibacillus xylanilyticus TaxID=582475 RepID=A0ABT4EZS8_9BACI|nr:endospore germination permease [Lysinibacillus xylanilyticus]MCY9549724.1 endospore germination permease [Lysinibacillus xylanilyticus]
MEKEIISSRQFMIITLLFSIGTAILILPAGVTIEAKQDAWIAAIIGVVLSLPVIKLFVAFGNRTPTLTFVEANEKILGRFFGKFTSIGFILIALLSAGELLYFIGIFMKTEIMPETPTMAFAFLFSIIIIYAAFLGIEVFARSAEILFPIFILIFIFFVIFISPSIKIENLQPIMETPKKSIFFSMIRFISLFSFPLVMLLMIFPSAVNVQKSAQKGFYIGSIIGGIVLITIITLCILVLGPANTASRTFPSYSLAQRISIGNFLQRIEVIMATMWIISIYIRTFMYFYAAVIGIAQICKINNHRPLIFPLGMIILGISQIVHPSIIHSDIYNRDTWPIFSFVIMIFLPLVLLIVAKIRKINGNQGNNTKSNCSTQNESGSNNGNSTQSAGSNNNDISSQSKSSNNGGIATQGESNSNNDNSTQNDSSNNAGITTQNASNSNNDNSTQNDSSSNAGITTQNASNSNNDNSTQNDSSNNSGGATQSESSSNVGNATQGESSSNKDISTQSDNSSNNDNPSPSKSDYASSNTTQNDSDTGNTPNSDKNKESPES